jgi:hypothetical protein
MRYLMDLIPCASILAGIGYWRLLERTGPRGGRWAQTAAVAVVGWQSLLALVLSITGYYSHFAMGNPPFFQAMAKWAGVLLGRRH